MAGRMLGVAKDGEISLEQQYLLFCIVLRKRSNVGRVMYNRIEAIEKSLVGDKFRKFSLTFPSLITRLCQNVQMQEGFYRVNNLAALDRDVVSVNVGQVMRI